MRRTRYKRNHKPGITECYLRAEHEIILVDDDDQSLTRDDLEKLILSNRKSITKFIGN